MVYTTPQLRPQVNSLREQDVKSRKSGTLYSCFHPPDCQFVPSSCLRHFPLPKNYKIYLTNTGKGSIFFPIFVLLPSLTVCGDPWLYRSNSSNLLWCPGQIFATAIVP